jgi:hypothetical protein
MIILAAANVHYIYIPGALFFLIILFQNTSITVDNTTYISDNVSDNPRMYFYNSIHGAILVVILITTCLRSLLLMKVGPICFHFSHEKLTTLLCISPYTGKKGQVCWAFCLRPYKKNNLFLIRTLGKSDTTRAIYNLYINLLALAASRH